MQLASNDPALTCGRLRGGAARARRPSAVTLWWAARPATPFVPRRPKAVG